jgi:hypothetical protein
MTMVDRYLTLQEQKVVEAALRRSAKPVRRPSDCDHCAYDRKFPETKRGGWLYLGNNGPYVCCPMCNPAGDHRR